MRLAPLREGCARPRWSVALRHRVAGRGPDRPAAGGRRARGPGRPGRLRPHHRRPPARRDAADRHALSADPLHPGDGGGHRGRHAPAAPARDGRVCHLELGATTRCSGWCRWTTPPGTSTAPPGTSSASSSTSRPRRCSPQAAYWAGRTYFDANNPSAACRWLADGMAQARNDVEVQNQLGYPLPALRPPGRTRRGPADGDRDSTRPGHVHPGRLAAGSAATPEPPRAARRHPHRRPRPPASAPPARTVYRVQIAAVASRKSAEDAARKARPLGLSVVTVQDKGLYKVRVGEYRTREAAQNAAASLKARLGGSPFVVAEP